MATMKQAGVTQKNVIDFIINDICKDMGISKAKANELFTEALCYNIVVAEIREKIGYLLKNPNNRLTW